MLSDPTSLRVIVNKLRPLIRPTWTPPDLTAAPVPFANPPLLRAAATEALTAMFAAARTEGGGRMLAQSAFRSFATQQSVYADAVRTEGQAGADRSTALPGRSEHQTGLAVDMASDSGDCTLRACFADTSEGRWLAGNAWRFGFVLRYPDGREAITGYRFEPWHYRYVGTQLAAELHTAGSPTLEEYFGLEHAG